MEATSESEMDEEQSDTTAMSSNETNPIPKASVADCDMEDNKSGYVMIVDAKECKSSNEKDSQGKDGNSSDKDETINLPMKVTFAKIPNHSVKRSQNV